MKSAISSMKEPSLNLLITFWLLAVLPIVGQVPAQELAAEADAHWFHPQKTYEERRELYLRYCASHPTSGKKGLFSQVARLELNEPPLESIIREAIDYVYSNKDCNDFTVAGLLRILYRYRENPLLSASLIADIEICLLSFKYWWDEPGRDRRCYHTENHQIIYHADELLAGQLFKERIFMNNGEKGNVHIQHAVPLIRRWMDFRIKFGFSEWLSNCYFDEDLLALLNLYDFAEDPSIRSCAGKLIDLLLFEMSLHNYHGIFGSTHGRTYARMIKDGWNESTASTMKLIFGMGVFNRPDAMGAISLATSSYRCPPIILQIAVDDSKPLRCRERHSLNIEDAPLYGLSFQNELDCHFYWSIQDYAHPKILALSQQISEKYSVRQHEDYQHYIRLYEEQLQRYGKIIDPDLDCHALTEVNIETYRTADYLLSCAQDYRPGRPGYQQHIWQATLGIDAMVFTSHPGSTDEKSRPNYWAGNGIMPRAAQYQNVLICIHQVPADDPFPFSHAYFPVNAFDEIAEKGQWIFGRKGDGYIGLYSQNPARWAHHEDGYQDELVVDYPDNIWICEMGAREKWADFSNFVQTLSESDIRCEDLQIDFQSPSAGKIHFGWTDPLRVEGETISLTQYQRFDNPYCQADFNSTQLLIQHGEQKFEINFYKLYQKF